jgi:hypothetical protein
LADLGKKEEKLVENEHDEVLKEAPLAYFPGQCGIVPTQSMIGLETNRKPSSNKTNFQLTHSCSIARFVLSSLDLYIFSFSL